MWTRRRIDAALAAFPLAPGLAGPVMAATAVPPVWGTLQPGPHAVGYSIRWIDDPSRRAQDGGEGARAIQLSVWAPASPTTARPMRIGDYARLLANPGPRAPRSWPANPRGQMAITLDALPRDASRLEALEGFARFDASPARGRFPLVLFGQGLFYESPLHQFILAEYLASHGFVVATAPLTGAGTFLARLVPDDFEAHIRDIECVAAAMGKAPNVAPGRTAMFGWDLGGMAALALAARNPQLGAVVAFDSGIASPTHVTRFLDRDYAGLQASLLHVSRPLAELEARGLKEDLALIRRLSWIDRAVVRVPGMRHADFAIHGMIEGVLPGFWGNAPGKPHEQYPPLAELARAVLTVGVKDAGPAVRTLGGELLPAGHRPLTLEALARAALLPGTPGLAAMVAEDALKAIDADSLWRLAAELLYRRENRTAAALVGQAAARAHPDSEPLREIARQAAG